MTDDIMAALARIEEQNRQIIAMLTGMPHVGGYAPNQPQPYVVGYTHVTPANQCSYCGAYYGLDGHLCPVGYPNR
jgi:hypothetical protein